MSDPSIDSTNPLIRRHFQHFLDKIATRLGKTTFLVSEAWRSERPLLRWIAIKASGGTPAPSTVRFVNTASTAGGDGTTNATAGANRAYVSLADWDTAETTDITTGGTGHAVYCSGVVAGSPVSLSASWVTDAAHPLTISANDLPFGDTDYDAAGFNYTDYLSDQHFRIDRGDDLGPLITVSSLGAGGLLILAGLQMRFTVVNTQDGIEGSDLGAGAVVRLEGCRIEGGTAGQGINLRNTTGTLAVEIYNSVINDWAVGADPETANTTMALVNSVVTSCSTAGLARTAGVLEAFNTISFDNADDWPAAMDEIYACASDDGNAADPLHVDISPGGTEADDWDATLANYAEGNYRMIPAVDNSLFLAGTAELLDQSSLSLSLRSTDIRGNSLNPNIPSIGSWEFRDYQAALFDGVSDRMVRDATLTSDSNTIALALDFDLLASADGTEITIFESTSGRMSLKRTSANVLQFTSVDRTSGTTIIDVSSAIDVVAADGRLRVLIRARSATGPVTQMWINDIDVTVETTALTGTQDLTEAKFVIGADINEAENSPVGMRMFWLNASDEDWSILANRRLVFNADASLNTAGLLKDGSGLGGGGRIFYLFDDAEGHAENIVEPNGHDFVVNGALMNRAWPPDYEWSPIIQANGDWFEMETDNPLAQPKTVI